MTSVVWKMVLKPTDVQDIEVPEGAEFLCVMEQYGQLAVWYRCDPAAPKVKRRIAVCGTGHPAPDAASGRYVGTALLHGGTLVFHVFEQVESLS